jgi:hypothetical protein
MNQMKSGIVKTAASMAVAGGLIMASALPAAAAPPNRAYGVSATGLIGVREAAEATYPGSSPVTVAHANLGGLLSTGTITDRSGPGRNSSRVAAPAVTLSRQARLQASMVRSSCTFNTNTGMVRGSAGMANGQIQLLHRRLAIFAASPMPNTIITVRRIGKVTLNRQTTAKDGTLTVTAIYIALIGKRQTLSLGTSVCNQASLAPVPILAGKATGITLAGLGLLLAGSLGYQVSKRRRAAAG